MARQIEITQMDDFFQEKIIDLVQATTLEWTKRVKKATPVDTGRLRGAGKQKYHCKVHQEIEIVLLD